MIVFLHIVPGVEIFRIYPVENISDIREIGLNWQSCVFEINYDNGNHIITVLSCLFNEFRVVKGVRPFNLEVLSDLLRENDVDFAIYKYDDLRKMMPGITQNDVDNVQLYPEIEKVIPSFYFYTFPSCAGMVCAQCSSELEPYTFAFCVKTKKILATIKKIEECIADNQINGNAYRAFDSTVVKNLLDGIADVESYEYRECDLYNPAVMPVEF